MSSPAAQPRKFPPPCWTDDEAQALISVYKQKWTSLNRTNLKSHDWDDVAASLAAQFPAVSPSKTPVQCHNKIEKLRKRFRSEKHRAAARPGRFSPWSLYPLMADLDSLSAPKPDPTTTTSTAFPVRSLGHRNLSHEEFIPKRDLRNESSGYRRKLESGVGSSGGGGGVVRKADPAEEIVSSIRSLGEKYMKVEKRKMEMAREIVVMQMDMEMKQTQVIMESQQQMVSACVSALLESRRRKKKNRKINVAPSAD
ncbi:trihelix transcription factor ENAP1-like [Argentina anserina]|uniref:trihelix transcription factor ENAP1-like n=1 Tax=Argentina anserina TaxID=57926 RepID=UPI0021766AE3|nr:trihelix transcription factor ENAP1-like [Potentilla anserina]